MVCDKKFERTNKNFVQIVLILILKLVSLCVISNIRKEQKRETDYAAFKSAKGLPLR